MAKLRLIQFTFLTFQLGLFAQNDVIKINAFLNLKTSELEIQQTITYFNNSNKSLDTIYLLNWSNSFKDRHTPLSKRLIEDYDKSLYFAKKKYRGYTNINAISEDFQSTKWLIDKNKPDIIKVVLNKPLASGKSTKLTATYLTKLPEDTFTKYGKNNNTINLRYWHLVPAVYDGKWHTISNLNMDDYYMNPTNYDIEFKLQEGVNLISDLNVTKVNKTPYTIYKLTGKSRVDIELNINVLNDFKHFKTDNLEVITNLNGTLLKHQVKKDVLNRQLAFIENRLGNYPYKKILVNKISYDKNPIYGLNQLPKFLNPFSGVFEWDIKMFKVLSKRFIENTLLLNRREDYWLVDGIQTYLMIQYVEKFYPEIKAMGKISKIWGIRSYQLAKLNFNDKYAFVNQFAMRRNLDQALSTRADSLSTFNRKIVNKYKAGIGLAYLDQYLNDSIVFKSIKQFYSQNVGEKASSIFFKELITQKTTKDLRWFFGDYINSKKKIDYTIKKVVQTKDSITVTIKNKRNFTTPIALYGIKQKEIKFKKWFTNIDSTSSITIPKGDYSRLSLNYENIYPELNLNNNWKNLKSSLLNRPILFRFLKDVDNPYYNQVFYNLEYDYNYYDGLILGTVITNKTLFTKRWVYKITPTYGTTSKQLTGNFSFLFQHFPEESSIYKVFSGVGGSLFHYAPDLSYRSITPFVGLEFNRKSLRDVGGNSLFARYVLIDKEPDPNSPSSESDNYGIFNMRYNYFKPDIIKDLRYMFDFQLGKNFSKITADFRYRKLTNNRRQFDFRAFFGTFLHNNNTSNYFDFALDRPIDYLFDYDYLGRSEESGFLSQQIIIAEGGFKSKFANPFANQWMLTSNGSVSIWRWIEAYADVGIYKNKNQKALFRYDSGIRLNFVHNFIEVYFPLQSSLGFEPNQPNYSSKIRFVLTLDIKRVYNFVKRGFY